MPAQKNKPELKQQVLDLLGSAKYQPLDKVGISKKLGVSSDARVDLRKALHELEQDGAIARIRKDRYVIPEAADLCTGVLQMHQSGSAHVLCEKGGRDLYIAAENTWTALNGDCVVARVMHEGAAQRERQMKQFCYVIPDEPRFVHNIYVRAGETQLARPPRVGDKVVVKLDEWKSRHVNPEGEIIELLGPASAPGVDMLSIIRKHHLPAEFPAAVLREAEKISETIDE